MFRLAALVVIISLAPLPAQRILRVGPGQPFTDLQPAIDFAVAGDRILVDPGTYGPALGWLTISKGVRIVGQPGTVLRSLRFGVPAGEAATVAGVEIRASNDVWSGLAFSCVSATDSRGVVALDQCRLSGWPGGTIAISDFWSLSRLSAIRSAAVLACRCTFDACLVTAAASYHASSGSLADCGTLTTMYGWQSGAGGRMELAGGPGVTCSAGGQVTISRTGAIAGPALSATANRWATNGEPGILVDGTDVVIAGPASAIGSAGGNGSATVPFTRGGDGGAGVRNDGTLFLDRTVALTGGAGGTGNPPGIPGPPVAGTPPQVVDLPVLTGTTLQLPGGSFQLDGFAQPGTFLYLALNWEALPVALPGVHGLLIPRLDANVFVEGPILVGASGRVTRTIPIPPDPNLRGTVLFAQAVGIDPAAFPLVFLSAAVTMTVAF